MSFDKKNITTDFKTKAGSLMAILRSVNGLLLHFNASGKFLSAFYSGVDLLPLDTNELAGKHLREVFDEGLAEKFVDAIAKTLSIDNLVFDFDIHTNGRRYFTSRFTKFNDEEVICLARDITKQRETELEFKKSEERFRNLVLNLNEAVYEFDETGILTFVSPAIEKSTGFCPSELEGNNIGNLIKDTRYNAKNQISKLLYNDELQNDYRIFNKAGEVRWARFTTKAIIKDGVFRGGAGAIIDITDNKKSEINLRKSIKKYQLLAENISDVITVHNYTKNKFTYISPSVFQLRGFSPEEAVGQAINEMVHADFHGILKDFSARLVSEFLASPNLKKADTIELMQICKNGSLVWTETVSQLRYNDNGDVESISVTRDIDTRKKTEKKLIKYAEDLEILEDKFSSVFNLSPVIMLISYTDDKGIIDVNRKFIEKLGYSKEEVYGKVSEDFKMFDDPGTGPMIREILKSEDLVSDFEVKVRTKSGNLLLCQLAVSKIKLKNFTYILSTLVDITAIKENELKIKNLLNQQKLITEISRGINLPGTFRNLICNSLQLIGLQTGADRVFILEYLNDDLPADWISPSPYEWCRERISPRSSLFHYLPEDTLLSVKNIILQNGSLIADNISSLPFEIFSILESLKIKSLLIYPLYFQDKLNGYIGLELQTDYKTWTIYETGLLKTLSNIFATVFERKSVIDKIIKSELRLKLAIDGARGGIMDRNIATDSMTFSDGWYRMTGFTPHELNSGPSRWECLVSPEDSLLVKEAIDKHFDGEDEFFEVIYRIKTKDGLYKWILEHGAVVKRAADNRPIRAIGISIDITKQKETEIKLRESVETQQKLFSVISHDLRGPLGNFIKALDLLSDKSILDGKMRSKLLEELKKSSKTTFTLLENLLNWSSSQSNTIRIEPWHYSISKLLHDNVEQIASVANSKFINILMSVDDRLSVYCDKDSINLVIRNLLANAIKFTRENGTIRISTAERGSRIEVIIEDNGVGMDKVTAENLFTMNTFRSTYGTNNEKGSGLGLVLCSDLIDRNGGRLRAESKPGEGSRFIFTLPESGNLM